MEIRSKNRLPAPISSTTNSLIWPYVPWTYSGQQSLNTWLTGYRKYHLLPTVVLLLKVKPPVCSFLECEGKQLSTKPFVWRTLLMRTNREETPSVVFIHASKPYSPLISSAVFWNKLDIPWHLNSKIIF